MSHLIYAKIAEVMNEIGSIAKDQRNDAQNYRFRGIDDVYNALHQPLANAKIFYVPEVIEQSQDIFEVQDGNRVKRQIRVRLRVKYTFYAEDSSSISTIVEGEAIDSGDKATNKAMSAALKYMLIQVFCIPTLDMEDADKSSPEIGKPANPKPHVVNHAPQARPLNSAPKPVPKPQAPAPPRQPEPPSFDNNQDDSDNSIGSYVFTFGKFKGERLSNVTIHDLNGYVQWLKSKNGTFTGRLRQEVPTIIAMIEEFLNTRDISKRGAM